MSRQKVIKKPTAIRSEPGLPAGLAEAITVMWSRLVQLLLKATTSYGGETLFEPRCFSGASR